MSLQNAPKIGVVIPIYNVAPYLRECLDSVVNQTYGNFEVCLVNDGSTDILEGESKSQSLQIALEYVAKDKRFVLIDKANGGQSSARNTGIAWFNNEFASNGNLSLQENVLYSHTERSEVSKTRESKRQGESRTENRINKLKSNKTTVSPLGHCNSHNLDSRVLDSSLRALHFAQNDEVKNSPSLAEGVRGWVISSQMTLYAHPNNANLNPSKINYIIFLDSDDFWDSDLLEKCVRFAQNTKNSCGSIVSEKSGLRSHEQGNRTWRPLTKRVASLPDLSPQDNAPPDIIWFDWREIYESKTPPNPHSQTMLELFDYANPTQITAIEWLNRAKSRHIYQFWWAWQGLIRFEVLQKIHLRFLEGIIYEDNLFGVLLFSQCESIAIMPRKLYNYRIRGGSTTTTAKDTKSLPPFVEQLRGHFGDLAWEYFCAFSLCEMTLNFVATCDRFEHKERGKLCRANFLPHFLAQSCDILRFERDIYGTKARLVGLLKKERKNLQILQIISFIVPRAFKGVRYFLFLLCIKPQLALFRIKRKALKILRFGA